MPLAVLVLILLTFPAGSEPIPKALLNPIPSLEMQRALTERAIAEHAPCCAIDAKPERIDVPPVQPAPALPPSMVCVGAANIVICE